MRAAIVHEYGAPDVVRVEEIDSPPIGDGQVLVRMRAASVNFPDVLIVANRYQLSVPTPFVPGSEFAGEIVAVDAALSATSDKRQLGIGDRVFGTGFVGAFAEEVVANAATLTRIPDGVDFSTAAAFGVAHRTAWHTLRTVAELQAGEELIVLGAGGGVGLAAVQLGAHLGARVTAVASSQAKLDAAQTAGAVSLVASRSERGIDGGEVDFRGALKAALPDGADVVVDPVGGALSEPALRALRYGGRFVTVGYAAGEIPKIPLNLVLLKGITIKGFEFRSFATKQPEVAARNEAELLELMAAGIARPHICKTFTLDETAAALQFVADGNAIGKVVIEI